MRAVLDSSVVMKWFRREEHNSRAAASIRKHYESGSLHVVVPRLLFLEVLNVAGRRWGWDEDRLLDLASALDGMGFETGEAGLEAIASWTSKGLTAYDAAFVALAEAERAPLISDDAKILRMAPSVARALSSGL